jgi:hypothetical protein
MNIVRASFELITTIANNCNLTKRTASQVLTKEGLDKLADMKVSEFYNTCLSAVAEVCGPKFVVQSITKNTASCTKPKVLSESCNTIVRMVGEFGAHTVNLKDVIDWAKV